MNRLKGKVAIITGAASGMGSSHSRLLAQEGAAVALADVNVAAAEKVAAEIREAGGRAMAVRLNVSDENDWTGAFDTVAAQFGRVNVLVNNAGVIGYTPVVDTTLEDWNRVFSVNVTGTFLGCREAGRRMSVDGKGGVIVNISSCLGMVAAPGAAAYVASKGAVTMLTKAAAVELASASVRVNSVHPGLVDTPMIAKFRDDPEAVNMLLGPTLIRRPAAPVEISHAVVFLASDESSYVTGSAMLVDGGYSTV